MSRTYAKAEMKFKDISAVADASLSTNGTQAISNLDIFKANDNLEQAAYGTLEHNQFILDESKSIIPHNVSDIGFWSSEQSSQDCLFKNNPVIEITFSEFHTSTGITLYFADEYATEVLITWYDLKGTKLTSKVFYPNSLMYVCKHQVKNYGKIRIEFIRTMTPYRYIKLQYVLYGQHIIWEKDLIQTAKVYEEIDQTSSTLPINTAEISVIDVDGEFDVGNEDGLWKSIQKKQEVTLSEYIDGE